MGGYSGNSRKRLGLIALLALRRARAESLRRADAEPDGDATDDDLEPTEAAPRKKRRFRWF